MGSSERYGIQANENAGSDRLCKYDLKPEVKKPGQTTFFLLISALMGDPLYFNGMAIDGASNYFDARLARTGYAAKTGARAARVR